VVKTSLGSYFSSVIHLQLTHYGCSKSSGQACLHCFLCNPRLPRLATWDPAKETDAFQFEVNDEHRLPAIGGPEALHILLLIEELKLEQPINPCSIDFIQ
jgi:hypothetical protein